MDVGEHLNLVCQGQAVELREPGQRIVHARVSGARQIRTSGLHPARRLRCDCGLHVDRGVRWAGAGVVRVRICGSWGHCHTNGR